MHKEALTKIETDIKAIHKTIMDYREDEASLVVHASETGCSPAHLIVQLEDHLEQLQSERRELLGFLE